MKDSYIHLNVHTEYSIADGIIKIPQLVERCKKQNFSAVAVTDLNNLFSAIKFNREAKKAGIKPIIGSEVTIMPSDTNLLPFNVIFLCKNKFGYKNLCEILTLCQQRKEDQVGVTETEISRSIMEGIIVISGDQFGDIGQAILKKDDAEFADAIGDMVVVLTNLAHLGGTTIEQCIDQAYNEIKNRKGKMSNGTFVKND